MIYPPKNRLSQKKFKFIPLSVLKQLDKNIKFLTPTEFIPIIILLRASGWRISDILNLRYDNCLEKTDKGWYLCGFISKSKVSSHRVPISEKIAEMVKTVMLNTKEHSTEDNNPQKLLFVRLHGKRKGFAPVEEAISNSLNRLAIKQNITDDQGNIYKFNTHAFRHTKAVELINNGMNILHVQKWLAHRSPESTLIYAKILDNTMRESWEQILKNTLSKIDNENPISFLDLTKLNSNNYINWKTIKASLDAVKMPFGYCLKSKYEECLTQLIPCLDCKNLCTTEEFIPQYESEIKKIKEIIYHSEILGRDLWVQKNTAILNKYEQILEVLKKDITHHRAGKIEREYTKEEFINDK